MGCASSSPTDDDKRKEKQQQKEATAPPAIKTTPAKWWHHPLVVRHKLVKRIGKGGFSEVWLAEDLETGERKALKVVRLTDPDLQEGDAAVLLAEAKFLRTLDCPYLVKCSETAATPDHLFLLLELLTGGELLDNVHQIKAYSEAQAARLFAQLVSAISYLHTLNLMHMDIKPENVMFESPVEECEEQGRPLRIKVIDMGMSTQYDPNKPIREATGTPGFAAPELFNGGCQTPASDVYSLGVVLFIMLTGRKPHSGHDIRCLTYSDIPICRAPGLKDQRFLSLSSDAQDLLLKMLADSPRDRPSCLEVLRHPFIAAVDSNMDAHRQISEVVRRRMRELAQLRRLHGLRYAMHMHRPANNEEARRMVEAMDQRGFRMNNSPRNRAASDSGTPRSSGMGPTPRPSTMGKRTSGLGTEDLLAMPERPSRQSAVWSSFVTPWPQFRSTEPGAAGSARNSLAGSARNSFLGSPAGAGLGGGGGGEGYRGNVDMADLQSASRYCDGDEGEGGAGGVVGPDGVYLADPRSSRASHYAAARAASALQAALNSTGGGVSPSDARPSPGSARAARAAAAAALAAHSPEAGAGAGGAGASMDGAPDRATSTKSPAWIDKFALVNAMPMLNRSTTAPDWRRTAIEQAAAAAALPSSPAPGSECGQLSRCGSGAHSPRHPGKASGSGSAVSSGGHASGVASPVRSGGRLGGGAGPGAGAGAGGSGAGGVKEEDLNMHLIKEALVPRAWSSNPPMFEALANMQAILEGLSTNPGPGGPLSPPLSGDAATTGSLRRQGTPVRSADGNSGCSTPRHVGSPNGTRGSSHNGTVGAAGRPRKISVSTKALSPSRERE
ncbi:hypothetical protein HYH03_013316 [Edaphochlamys debaryana]|uniref:Protein kinase domain-containing protein n=1 Tax=Edaphochlamys debaryana TaxID=47281 RepID=A0A835XR30_9CHLO|nr:hypothetical protein HYH03_013316 [Edaphochlamys debaryana]|eukprot:KAG2488174.1 hypothetical protein HYH03_013316 [Edaphochlamys debaryana]